MKKSLIVVEGIHDEERIRKIYKDAFIITTNGSEISDSTLKMIKEYSNDYDILIFTDPDHPGERIRAKIHEVVSNPIDLFLPKKPCISKNKKKVGIEHAPTDLIKEVLDNYEINNKSNNLITNEIMIDLGLVGEKNSSILRNKISLKLNIGQPNAKTFMKRVNALGLSKCDLEKIIGEVYEK